MVPGLRRLITIRRPGYGPAEKSMVEVREAAGRLKIEVLDWTAGSRDELRTALAQVRPDGADGIMILPDSFVITNLDLILEVSLEQRVPTFGLQDFMADWGALGAYGPSAYQAGGRIARYVDKIAKGAKPGDLPVEPIDPTLVVNLKAAECLGVSIPPAAPAPGGSCHSVGAHLWSRGKNAMQHILAIAVGTTPGKDRPEVLRGVIKGGRVEELRPYIGGLIAGLDKLGRKGGEDYEIDYATCDLATFKKLVKGYYDEQKPDAIFAMSTSALKCAMSVCKETPIIFPSISDPMEDGGAKSNATPGKNATGIRAMRRQTAPDGLELFKVTVPSLKTVYALHKPAYGPAKSCHVEHQEGSQAGACRLQARAREVPQGHREGDLAPVPDRKGRQAGGGRVRDA